MNVLALFSCAFCIMNSSPNAVFLLSFCLGGVLVSYVLLKPFVKRVSKIWGWPHLNVGSGVGLLAMLCWPSLICWAALQRPKHSVSLIAICTAGLVLCAVYLWLRGTWLLEQRHAATWFRQILFHGILWPTMLITGILVGEGIVALVFLGVVSPSSAIPWFYHSAGTGVILGLFVFAGLNIVFHQSDVIEPELLQAPNADSQLEKERRPE